MNGYGNNSNSVLGFFFKSKYAENNNFNRIKKKLYIRYYLKKKYYIKFENMFIVKKNSG